MRPSRGQVIGTLGAVALLAALVLVGRLDAPGRLPRASIPSPASTTATPPTPTPTADTTVPPPTAPRLRGVPLGGTGLAALLIPEPSPSVLPGLFWLDSARLTPIGGVPHGGCYANVTRLPHGWALGRLAYQPAGQGCPEPPTPMEFYLLADGASVATRLPVTADQVLAGDSDARLWLVTNLRQPDPDSSQVPPQAVQQVDRSGHPCSPPYRVPDGYVAWRGVIGGSLLLTLAEQGPADTSLYALWDPRSGRLLRRFDQVLATTPSTIAWVAAGCGPQRCPVHLVDLASGTDTQVASPRGVWADGGAFSPDGRYLAVVFRAGVDATGAPTQATVWVVDATKRRLRVVPGAVMRGGDFGLAVTWSPDGAWLLLSAPVGQHTEQLAAWRLGDTVLHIPRRHPPTGQHVAPRTASGKAAITRRRAINLFCEAL
jgi:hypothetical protein